MAFLAVVGFLAWVGWGMEPHWSSKDGHKFTCIMHLHPEDANDRPRWRDVKVSVDGNELVVYSRTRRSGNLRGVWKVVGAVNDGEKNRRLYEVRTASDAGATIRVPQSSRCVPVLDRLVP
jgi:hypothetical protein